MIDLGDDMHFEVLSGGKEDTLECNMADVPTDRSNLVLRVPCACFAFLHALSLKQILGKSFAYKHRACNCCYAIQKGVLGQCKTSCSLFQSW